MFWGRSLAVLVQLRCAKCIPCAKNCVKHRGCQIASKKKGSFCPHGRVVIFQGCLSEFWCNAETKNQHNKEQQITKKQQLIVMWEGVSLNVIFLISFLLILGQRIEYNLSNCLKDISWILITYWLKVIYQNKEVSKFSVWLLMAGPR